MQSSSLVWLLSVALGYTQLLHQRTHQYLTCWPQRHVVPGRGVTGTVPSQRWSNSLHKLCWTRKSRFWRAGLWGNMRKLWRAGLWGNMRKLWRAGLWGNMRKLWRAGLWGNMLRKLQSNIHGCEVTPDYTIWLTCVDEVSLFCKWFCSVWYFEEVIKTCALK